MLDWFKLKKPEDVVGTSPYTECESSGSGSPASSSKSLQNRVMFSNPKESQRRSISRKVDNGPRAGSFSERTQAGDLFSAAIGVQRLLPTGSTITDQMDLFLEQIKMLAGEVALSSSFLKRLSEQAAKSPGDTKLLENIQKLKDEIREKKRQMRILEQRMIGSVETSPYGTSIVEMSQALSRLATQLNEKTFELEIKSADNRVLQEQLREKTLEAAEMQETITLLRQQNSSADSITTRVNSSEYSLDNKNGRGYDLNSCDETSIDESTLTSVESLNRSIFDHGTAKECTCDAKSQLLAQAAEIESLKQDKLRLVKDQEGLEIHCQKQTDEASYEKELAAAAAVELRNLAEEVTKLSYQNAQLTADLADATNTQCKAKCCQKSASIGTRQNGLSMEEFEEEMSARYHREASLVAALSERDRIEADLRKRLDETKRYEEKLENELANMRGLVAKMRKSNSSSEETRQPNGIIPFPDGQSRTKFFEIEESEISEEFDELKVHCQPDRRRFKHV